jgi:hypothetical protein
VRRCSWMTSQSAATRVATEVICVGSGLAMERAGNGLSLRGG